MRRLGHAGIATVLLAALGTGIGMHVAVIPARADDDDDKGNSVKQAPSRVTVRDGKTVLTLSAADQRNAGIVTARVEAAPAQRSITGYGTVLDTTALSAVSNRYLEAATVVRVDTAKLAASRAAFERARLLHSDRQNVSAAQLQTAEASFQVDEAQLASARAQQEMIRTEATQAWGDTLGTALLDRTPLLADLLARRDYLVRVTLPPGVPLANPPPTAQTRWHGGAEAHLRFLSAATTADPQLQGISLFYTTSAASGLLPGLRLTVTLNMQIAERGVVVPEAAVVWSQGQAWIYQRTDASSFERRTLVPDGPAPGGYVVHDLPDSAEIVVRGAQMLLSEEFRAQAPVED